MSQPIIQQDLKRCRLRSTPYCMSVVFFILSLTYAMLFCLFGLESLKSYVVSVRYDDVCANTTTCLISFNITQPIRSPVGMYYRLTKMSQMRREIASSYSTEMLKGKYVDIKHVQSQCRLEGFYDDVVELDALYVPCGLLPRNVFTDSLTLIPKRLRDANASMPAWDESNIILDVDKNTYKDPAAEYANSSHWLRDSGLFPGEQRDPHFIVWMRQSPFTPFRKLYKVIRDGDLPPGEYTMSIRNLYDAKRFNGEKWFVIAHIGAFGTLKFGPAIVFGVLSVFFLVAAGILGVLGWRRSQPTSLFHPKNLNDIFVKKENH